MKTNIKLLMLLTMVLLSPLATQAQEVGMLQDNTKIITTVNGDKLCQLSNGNTIPCEIAAEAEQLIFSGGKVKDSKTGELLCDYKNRSVACSQLNEKGGLKALSLREKAHDAVMYLVINRVMAATILFILLILAGANFFINKINYKRNNLFSKVLLAILLISNILFVSLFVSIARADVPLAPAAMCSCATSASQTCITSTPGTLWIGFSNYTVSSCSQTGSYTTYLWPNTPPQFFYQGIESIVGDVSTGNKHEAKGKEIIPGLALLSDTIGQDTGVACQRSSGVSATLKYTGKLNYTVQGICMIGTCQYYSKTAVNYSCY